MLKTKELLDLNHTIAKDYLQGHQYPWTILPEIKNYIIDLGNKLNKEEFNEIKENVWIHKTATVYESAYINGPCKSGVKVEGGDRVKMGYENERILGWIWSSFLG